MVHMQAAMHRLGPGSSTRVFVKLPPLPIPTLENDLLKQKLTEEMATRINEVMAMSPAKDIEKNLKAALVGWLAKLDLVTREEFDVQIEVLARSRARITQLEARLAALEEQNPPKA